MKQFIAATLIISSLSGCAAIQNEDGTTTNTALYGAGAALAGAVAGALISKDNRGQGALIGAAVAGTAGAGYGYYADKQEAELREQMKGSGVQVERQGNEIVIVMPGAITFATGKAEIQPNFANTLSQLAGSFRTFPDSDLIITGHTDSVGSYEANEVLSMRRAQSVAQFLQGNGVQPERVNVIGAGSNQPVASNDTAEGRAQNRRVEIKLAPRAAQASR